MPMFGIIFIAMIIIGLILIWNISMFLIPVICTIIIIIAWKLFKLFSYLVLIGLLTVIWTLYIIL